MKCTVLIWLHFHFQGFRNPSLNLHSRRQWVAGIVFPPDRDEYSRPWIFLTGSGIFRQLYYGTSIPVSLSILWEGENTRDLEPEIIRQHSSRARNSSSVN